VDVSARVDLNHGEPVASGYDNTLLMSSELMSNSDDEEVAPVVIDTILLFPTHPDLARTVSGATFTTSRPQLRVIGHGTKCTIPGPNRLAAKRRTAVAEAARTHAPDTDPVASPIVFASWRHLVFSASATYAAGC
jgi:hypothetical protein